MRINKLITTLAAAGLSVAAISAMSVSASAMTVVDFENGDYSFVQMKTDDGGDDSKLSVVDFNGSKQLKIDVQDNGLVPKIEFDINAMLGTENMSDVKTIEMELTIEAKDGSTPPGWAGGAIGTQGGEAGTPAWGQTAWEGGEYDNAVSEPMTIQRKFLLPSEKFVNGTENTTMLIMRWASDVPYNMYIDNIRFLASGGKEIELALDGSAAAAPVEEIEIVEEETAPETAPAEETAAPEEEAAPAVTTAPASDEQTTSTTTGNASAAAAATALVLASYGAFMTFKKNK